MLTFRFIFEKMLHNGSVENLLVLMNQKDMSLWSTNFGLMKGIMQVLSSINAGRSRAMIILNAITSFNMLFKAVSYFLDETTL